MTDPKTTPARPRPGQRYHLRRGMIRVDFVKPGWVLYAAFRPHAKMAHALIRKRRRSFCRLLAKEMARG